jgi:N-carbamoylputrescine amidase
MHVVAPSRIGEGRGGAPGAFYFGESLIVDPNGRIAAQASATGEDHLVTAEIDLDLLQRQRKTWLFFEDRRRDLYGALIDPDRLPNRSGSGKA